MSSDDVAIRVTDVSKHYLMFARPEDRLKQSIVPRLQRLAGRPPKQYYRDFAALSGVSFEVKRGETVGIIGRNGCGKSTLLQIVCGTLPPTSGTVEVNGRIAALLELGAGFNPEFTGRENVYMNGAILGLSRAEIDGRFDRIAAFADIGLFLEQPVKTYSSGMYVRLAFATAINVDPDILVVDEALAVGDEAFQRKCFARIEDIKDKGGTILFVSHGAQTIVQLCDRAILIDGGELLLDGKPKMVVGQYQRLVNLSGRQAAEVRETIRAMNGQIDPVDPLPATETLAPEMLTPSNGGNLTALAVREAGRGDDAMFEGYDPTLISPTRVEYESQGAQIRDVRITTLDGKNVNILRAGHRYVYEYTVDFRRSARNVGFGMLIKTVDGIALGGAATDFDHGLLLLSAAAGDTYVARFALDWSLTPGTYFLNAGVTAAYDEEHTYAHRLLDALAFRIAPSANLVATGYIDFNASPSIQLVDICVPAWGE